MALIAQATAMGEISFLRSLTSKARSFGRTVKRRIKPVRLAWLERSARDKTHWVSPAQIRFVSLKSFPSDCNGAIVDGHWDQLSHSFEELEWHKACGAVFRDGSRWSDTPFFRGALRTIQSGQLGSGVRTETELRAGLRQTEDLYRLTRDFGQLPLRPGSGVSVNVGRDGDLLFNEGKELLSVAKLLALQSIPVRIVVRHPQWMAFRNELQRDPRGSYSPLLHPDLEWIPSRTGHRRFDLIRSALVARGGRMLEIGCNWGYFC